MTQDEIIRMAREAGLFVFNNSIHPRDNDEPLNAYIERFAALVAEATKEKAAKVCEEKIGEWGYGNDYSFAADECAAAIRSMK